MITHWTLRPAERKAFEQLVANFKNAERELAIGFTLIAAARDEERASFVGLSNGVVEADLPEVQVVEDDDGN